MDISDYLFINSLINIGILSIYLFINIQLYLKRY
jgi:hypothetical protein